MINSTAVNTRYPWDLPHQDLESPEGTCVPSRYQNNYSCIEHSFIS